VEVKRLIRLDDGKEFIGSITFVVYGEDGRGKEISVNPVVGSGCYVDLESFPMFQWATTPIKEVINDNEFKTKNSHYKISEFVIKE